MWCAFLKFIAQDLREYMALLGFRTLDDMVGRSDLLDIENHEEHWKAQKLDFSALLSPVPSILTNRCAV